ncbi:hypothetical protein O4H49_04325 [Kiloniella laminariae]|uniref:Uncharacterized protein n=1 Tax=Kiloniella laminariae TaxID=454162 RepID=A0ABT4LI05_9PROT|nr:hypothetical protein [Kiloniella laminariae]MCZ4279991.1 hypothetical protein [Kiloniella laminariae]
MPKGSSRGARGTGSHSNTGNKDLADRAGRGGSDATGNGRSDNFNSNRSIATRELNKPPSERTTTKAKAKQATLASLDQFFDEEDAALNGLSRIPDVMGGGWKTEAEAYTPEQLEEMGKARGYETITENSRRAIARHRSPFAAFMHRLGSFFMPGVDSHLSLDPKTGQLASVDQFDAVGLGLGLAGGRGAPGVNQFANYAYAGLNELGIQAPTNTSTRALSDFRNGKQVSGIKSGYGSGNLSGLSEAGSGGGLRERQDGNQGLASPVQSLYEQATQVLYPYAFEEENPQYGVGVSFVPSTVRKAPKLSSLNARRARFGKG